jgi:trk system potassium uptake protein TrkA
MRVVIMGSGRTGSRLAELLVDNGHDVTVIDLSEGALSRLPSDFAGRTVAGNGVDQDVLEEAGIADADVFVAATSGDNRNIMASQIAQSFYHVPKVISRIKDPIRAEIFGQMGIEVDCRTLEGTDVVLRLLEESDEPAIVGPS